VIEPRWNNDIAIGTRPLRDALHPAETDLETDNHRSRGSHIVRAWVTEARWRRGWDSNPRYGFPYTRFPSERLKPLGHLSGTENCAGNIAAEFPVTTRGRAYRARNAEAPLSWHLGAIALRFRRNTYRRYSHRFHRHRPRRNDSTWLSLFWQTKKEVKQEDVMGRGLLLWLLGIPIPIIILIWVLGGLHG
jgi:hypothetical protein